MKKPSIEKTIETSQLAAIQKRLDGGKTLTAAQMAFVQDYHARSKATVASEPGDTARSDSQLARLLGVSRQQISYHRGREGSPKSFSVSQWRGYLLANGKGATIGRVGSNTGTVPAAPRRDTTMQQVECATIAQFTAISNQLPAAVAAALASEGVALPSAALDRVAFAVWLRLAAAQNRCAGVQGVAGVFDDDGEGVEYGSEIQKLAGRLCEPNDTVPACV